MNDTERKPATAADGEPGNARRTRYRARYVHRSAVRELVFRVAEDAGRGGVIQRVGSEVYAHLDAVVLKAVVALVRVHPSGLKTLEPFTPSRRRDSE